MSSLNRILFTGLSVVLGGALAVIVWSPLNAATPQVKTISSPQPPSGAQTTTTPGKKVLKLTLPASRTVFISGEIGNNAASVAKQILSLGVSEEPLYVVLNSPGGSVLDGAMILSAMEAASGPVYTVCNQLCASMAAIIFEYGTQRYMVDRSFVMFHPASGGTQGELDKMFSRLNSIRRYISKMEAHIANKVGISFAQYKALSGIELWVDAEDAVAANFADSIVSVILPEESTSVFMFPPPSERAPRTSYFILDPMSRTIHINWSVE